MTTPAQAFAQLQRLPPVEAIAYMKGRELAGETYHWTDLWREQHGRAFTVSRLARADLLEAMQQSLAKSVAGDMSRKDWINSAEKLLQNAGWWGTREVADPRTGEFLKTRFDHARLQLIFDTNVRQAQAAGQWQRMLRNRRTHPYARYVSMDDGRVRPLHRSWHNVTLPLDDPWWQTHRPPNGWRCRCRVIGVTQQEYDEGAAPERPGAATDGEAPEVFKPLVKQAPQDGFVDWRNPATGALERVPKGVDPGFDYNAGTQGASRAFEEMVQAKLARLSPGVAQAAKDDGLLLLQTARENPGVSDFPQFVRGELPGQRPIASIPDDVGAILGTQSGELLLSAQTAAKQYAKHPEIGIADYAIVQDMLDRGEIIKDRDLHIGIVHEADGWYYAVIKTTKTGKAAYLQSLRRTNLSDIERMRTRGEVVRKAL